MQTKMTKSFLAEFYWLQLAQLLVVVLFLAQLSACGNSAEKVPPEINRGIEVVRYFASPRYLRVSMYSATVEKHSPSELIEYLFSSMGAAERPPGDESSEMEKEQARATHTPIYPAGVRLVPLQPDSLPGIQLVLKPDNARNLIIVEGYTAPGKPPVTVAEIALAAIPPGVAGKH